MAVDAAVLAKSLHIDDDTDEIQTLDDIIEEASAMVDSSVSRVNLSYHQDPLYDLAVKSLSQALYYDRGLTDGVPNATKIMIVHLQANLGGTQ